MEPGESTLETTSDIIVGGLVVDLEGFEGPLDLLLALARKQKVDLAQISILALAEQYLLFVARLPPSQMELAADYLVMAAWLAYLKSRLLLPLPPEAEGPSGEELAADLALRLERLEAMRVAADRLMRRPLLGRDVFPRGEIETPVPASRHEWKVSLYDLLASYAEHHRRRTGTRLRIEPFDLFSVEEALERLSALLPNMPRWSDLAGLVPAGLQGIGHRSALSSHLVAALELARQGRAELHQEGNFTPLYLRQANQA